MPHSRLKSGRPMAGSIPSIPGAGFNGIAVIIADDGMKMTGARSNGGDPLRVTRRRSGNFVNRAILFAVPVKDRRFCNGPMIAG